VRTSTVTIAAILVLMSTAVAQEFAYYAVQKGDFPHDVAASP